MSRADDNSSWICVIPSSGRLQEVKNNRKSLTVRPQKVVAVAYRRWSFTRGFNCKALAGKILVFWIGARLWETIA